jgi:hypothetical protein
MSDKLIGIVVDDQSNIDLLSWSIFYLTAQEKYYYAGFDYWFDVVENPINEVTNETEIEIDGTTDITELTETINQLKNASGGTGTKIICLRVSKFADINPETFEKFYSECDRVIVIGVSEPTLYNNKLPHDYGEFDDYLSEYFSTSLQGWEDVENSPWDRREFIALNHRPFNSGSIQELVDLSKDHFYIKTSDLYLNLQLVLPDLFKYLDLTVDQERIRKWAKVYYAWSNQRADVVMWDRNFHTIVDYIVKGYSMDLTRFNLDILREATILHELLYKHNLNIKGYGLNELPRNTRDIHALLEPNFHPLTDY